MSIRLRLTLLYSAILTLTLLIFGVALYSIQAQDTLNALKLDLRLSSKKMAEAALPLSAAGLAALQNQQEWWQDEIVSKEHMLIYNRPIVQSGETVYIVQVARSLVERDRTTIPGFGLGLPIAKALVEGLGGMISVESKPGEGSEVRMRFQRINT